MTIEQLQELLKENSRDAGEEFKRIFHGRGGLFEGWKHLTVDSIDTILNVALFMQDEKEEELLAMLRDFVATSRYTTLVVQRRYLKGAPSEILMGEVPENLFAIENGMKLKLNLLSNQKQSLLSRYEKRQSICKRKCAKQKSSQPL